MSSLPPTRGRLASLAARLAVLLAALLVAAAPAGAQLIPDPSPHALIAEKDVEIDGDARVMGSVHANGKVEVKEGATVLGDVSAGDEIKNDGVILGEQTEGAPDVTLPNFDADDLRAMADRSFDDDHLFGDEVVDDIVFVDGTATLAGPVTGGGMILAADDILVDTPFVDGDLGDPPGPTLVAVKDVKVEKDMGWRGDLLAGKNVKLEDNSRLDGRAFAHDKVEVKKNIHVLGDPTDPPPELQKPFVLLEPASDVYRLFVGLAGDEIKIDKDSVVTGNIHSNDKIDVKKDALVDGNASAVGEIQGDGEITGSVEDNAAPQVLPYWPSMSSLQGLADRVFEDDVTFSDEIIDDVVFVFGKVEIEGSLRGGGTIIASRSVHFKQAAASPGLLDAVSVMAFDDIKIDRDWVLRGVLRAGDKIELRKNVTFEGVLLADGKIDFDKEATLRFLDLVPGTAGDVAAPRLQILSPGPVISDGGEVLVAVEYADAGAGVDVTTLRVMLDGESLDHLCFAEPSRGECLPMTPPAGGHNLGVEIADLVGNRARAEIEFVRRGEGMENDQTSPSIQVLKPAEGEIFRDRFVNIRGALLDDLSGIDPTTFTVSLQGTDIGETCDLLVGFEFSCQVQDLAPGEYDLELSVSDLAANQGTVGVRFVRLAVPPDDQTPEADLLEPLGPIRQPQSRARVGLNDSESGVDAASVHVWLDGSEVTPLCQVASVGVSCPLEELTPGSHELMVEASDRAGNVLRTGFVLTVEYRLPVTIEQPASGLVTSKPTIRVAGSTDPSVTTVTIGRVIAPAIDGAFEADVQLQEGANHLTAMVRGPSGTVGTETVTVIRDSEPPRVVVRSPLPGTRLAGNRVAVTGEVFDLSSSGAVDGGLEVFVNGLAAEVSQSSFIARDVLLTPGPALLVVEARDAVGNQRRVEVPVHVGLPEGPVIEILGGNGQQAAVGTLLDEPLSIRLVGPDLVPLAGRFVTFRVGRGDGQVVAFPDSARQVRVITDVSGLASVGFRLGQRAGLGVHTVNVSTPGAVAETTFFASAEPGPPARIRREVGDNQTGVQVAASGEVMPKPLLARVFDRLGNVVPDVPVIFSVDSGGGSFAGQAQVVVRSDATGRARAEFTVGSEALNPQVVTASFDGLDELASIYTVTALDPMVGPTAFEGLVLDNEDLPVAGVSLHVAGTDLVEVADEDGRFFFADVPAGRLLLEVDGSTALRSGTWPHLEFEVFTVAGRLNGLGMPVRLLPIDVAGGRLVGGGEDVTVPIAGVVGAELTVFAGSTTFPDGSPTGQLSVTQVHADKVPMIAPLGSNFMLAWTVQPPGVRFDPPARIAIPNLGEEVGREVEIFSFDHDFGEFVVAGTASVSEDGLQLRSNPGSGISKSGWGGCVSPPPPGADVCGNPGPCKKCVPGQRQPVPKCDDCQKCANSDGICRAKEIRQVEIVGNGRLRVVKVGLEDEVSFTTRIDADCTKFSHRWDFGDGETSTEAAPTHEYSEEDLGDKDRELFEVKVEVACDCDGQSPASAMSLPFQVVVERAKVRVGEVWDAQYPGSDCNRLPPLQNAGFNVPMLLGARTGTMAAVTVKDVEVRPASSFDKALVGVQQDGSSVVLGEQAPTAAMDDVEVEWDADPTQRYLVVAGIDENGDGDLDEDEIQHRQTDRTIRVITQSTYDASQSTLRGPSLISGLIVGDAEAYMDAFLGAGSLLGASILSTTVPIGDQDHPIGQRWNSGCTSASTRLYQFGPSHGFARKFGENRTVLERIQRAIVAKYQGDMQAYFRSHLSTAEAHFPGVLGAGSQWLTTDLAIQFWDWTLTNDFVDSRELQGALGAVLFDVDLLDVHVKRVGMLGSELRIESVTLRVDVHQDIFDFNITKTFFNEDGAKVQAGWDSLGPGGQPFYSSVEWQGTINDWPAPRFPAF